MFGQQQIWGRPVRSSVGRISRFRTSVGHGLYGLLRCLLLLAPALSSSDVRVVVIPAMGGFSACPEPSDAGAEPRTP